MLIQNLRLGFATNSSSSHSIVLLPNPRNDSYHDETTFGWEYFTLTSNEDKMRYLAAQLISLGWDNEACLEKIKTISPTSDISIGDYSGVDHQSVSSLFTNDDFIKVLLNDRIAILGGNDNSEPLELNDGTKLITDLSYGSDKVKFRNDKGYSIIFNPTNGTKVRLKSNETDPDYVKSSTPELVDLKITNYCLKNCKFCYQSSTPEGVHAKMDDILEILDHLKEAGVFEVAIGGGEPTSHPEFTRIIKEIKDRGMIPNFTTFTDDWLENPELVKACYDVGGIGVSCNSVKSLDLVKKINSKIYGPNIMAQHVFGSVPLSYTIDLMKSCAQDGYDLLLLGFKEVGFGKSYVRFDEGDDLDIFFKIGLSEYMSITCNTLSVDTAFIDQHPTIMKVLDAPKELATSPEGKFSCYIDAVTMKMGPSSYVEEDMMTDYSDYDNFISEYSKY